MSGVISTEDAGPPPEFLVEEIEGAAETHEGSRESSDPESSLDGGAAPETLIGEVENLSVEADTTDDDGPQGNVPQVDAGNTEGDAIDAGGPPDLGELEGPRGNDAEN